MKKQLHIRITLFLAALLLALSACTQNGKPAFYVEATDPNASLTVHFIDVGQADAALLLCDGKAMLIDGGNVADSSLVAAYLDAQGVSHLDYIVSTHAHEDHVGGLSGALNVCTVDTVYSPVEEFDSKAFRDFVKYVEAQGKSLTIPTPGDRFALGNAVVEILAPLRDDYDTNNSSIVLKVTHGDVSFLFTGDAERPSEEDMLAAGCNLDATVLKVGHHGSESSTSYTFLREIMPQYAVISVGEDNSYGHPTDAVLSRLRDAEVTLYRTDMQGHIVACSDLHSVTFSTEKQSQLPTNPTAVDGSGQNATPDEPPYYIGNQRSLKLHTPDCVSLPVPQNQVIFEEKDTALAEGYTPCGNCMPG